jgi:branched-subunit amino acid aminotransferase/4-amino-4-deoxychorismate lyase
VLIWVNGEMTPAAEATVNVLDHGLTVGDGVFETTKVVNGVPFAMDRHVTRLARSASGLGLPAPDESLVRKAAADVLTELGTPPLARMRIPCSSHSSSSRAHSLTLRDPRLGSHITSTSAPNRRASKSLMSWSKPSRTPLE